MIMLFDKRKEWADRYEQWRAENNVLDCAMSVISFLVANKWVQVVLCKDCEHWNEYYRECQSPNWDTGKDEYIIQPAGVYCAWGERKEQE